MSVTSLDDDTTEASEITDEPAPQETEGTEESE